jgi:hypothetical protein
VAGNGQRYPPGPCRAMRFAGASWRPRRSHHFGNGCVGTARGVHVEVGLVDADGGVFDGGGVRSAAPTDDYGWYANRYAWVTWYRPSAASSSTSRNLVW